MEIWNPKTQSMKIINIQIRSAQNVGKVWISRKKSFRPHLGPSQAFFPCAEKKQKNVYFPWWALAAIHPRWGNRYNIMVLFINAKVAQENGILPLLFFHNVAKSSQGGSLNRTGCKGSELQFETGNPGSIRPLNRTFWKP